MKNVFKVSSLSIVIGEIFLVSLILFILGFFLSRNDPFFLKTPFSPTLLIGLVLSLYYGFTSSLLLLLIISIASLFFYSPPPYQELLWHLLIFLVASEFHYYWQKKIQETQLEKEYLEEQISILRKELFLLKLSHDQLELNYVLRPYSLRRILEELKENLLRNPDEKKLMDLFLKILLQNFQVYKATVFLYKDGQLKPLATLGNEEITTNDILLNKAIEEESSVYLTPKTLEHIKDYKLHYVAVIREEVEGQIYFLAISDILFINLNEEVLSYIYIILSYIVEDIIFSKKLRKIYRNQQVPCSFNFIKELYKMATLNKKQGLESTLVFFSYENLPETYPYDLEQSIRKLDMLCILSKYKLVIFLLPFTSIIGAKSFSERIQKKFPALKFLEIKRVKKPNLNDYLKEIVNNAS